VVVNLDRITLNNGIAEFEEGDVGPAQWSVDSEKAQPGDGQVVQMCLHVSDQLITLFVSGIKADGVIDIVLFGEWYFLVGSIYGTGRGKYKMGNMFSVGRLEQVHKATALLCI
jgi:hypothetical protein